MRRLRAAICMLLVALLVPGILVLRGHLPVDVQPLIEKKYAGWSGTLRLWVFEGWTPGGGSAAGWLNRCVAAFEKRRGGVYIQAEYVDASAIRDFRRDGILPPDMMLFPPGLLEDASGLTPLDGMEGLRSALAEVGGRYAVPVMLGGYLWAYNPSRLESLPASWRDAKIMPSVPEDEPFRQWGTALLALCSGRRAAKNTGEDVGTLDLGLNPSQAEPTAPPPAEDDGLPCRLPEGFVRDPDAWRDFANGEAAAMLVTQREVRRLEALDEQGRCADWRLAGGAAGLFTDQALFLAIPERQDDGRLALCQAFARHLLSDACQGDLCRAGAFAVTDAPSGYGSGDALAVMDSALRSPKLAAAPAFGTAWKDAAAAIVRKFTDDSGDAAALWGELRAVLPEKAEH